MSQPAQRPGRRQARPAFRFVEVDFLVTGTIKVNRAAMTLPQQLGESREEVAVFRMRHEEDA